MYRSNTNSQLIPLLSRLPQARATVMGTPQYPQIRGTVGFHQTSRGVLVCAQITGLPTASEACEKRIFGFHIHEGGSCTGNASDPLANTGTHYDPEGCPHPYHAGDLPPLFGADGYAFSAFLSDRFTIDEVIGKTIIIHDHPDDFTTQPSGNSGTKIACGVITR